MFSGFQASMAQRNAFQINGGVVAPVEPTKGLGDEKRYRKYLERLEKITRTKEVKYSQKVVYAADKLDDLPIDTPELKKLSEKQEIDFDALIKDMQAIEQYLETMRLYRIRLLEIEAELDDEMAFLLITQ